MLVHLEKIGNFLCFFVRFMDVALGLFKVLQVVYLLERYITLGASMWLFTAVNTAMHLWRSFCHSGFLQIKNLFLCILFGHISEAG